MSFYSFLAVHNDPDNPDKLRPIGIGSAWRWLSSAVITALFSNTFAEFLLPQGQFGMSMRSGLNFMAHTATCQFDSFITKPFSNHLPPDRASLLIDLVNCWNQVSRGGAPCL
jgi:hypothetical protein